jgi:hypothetical protein
VILPAFLREWSRADTGKQKPGARPGLENASRTRDSYPAGCKDVGRRARDVIPAAMRALVRMNRVAARWVIGRRYLNWLSGRLNDGTDVLRIATTSAKNERRGIIRRASR